MESGEAMDNWADRVLDERARRLEHHTDAECGEIVFQEQVAELVELHKFLPRGIGSPAAQRALQEDHFLPEEIAEALRRIKNV